MAEAAGRGQGGVARLMRRSLALWIGLALLLACGACGGRATPTPTAAPPTPTAISLCTLDDGRKVYDVLQDYAREWEETLGRATREPGLALPAQFSQLQRIYRDVQAQDWPACGRAAQRALAAAMDASVDAVALLLGGEPVERVQGRLAEAERLMQVFWEELDRLAR